MHEILEINEDCSVDISEENDCELDESDPERETTQIVKSEWAELSSDSDYLQSLGANNFQCPLQIFFNILNLATINARILYKQCTEATISRKQCMFGFAEELDAENKENIYQRSGASSSSIILQERKSCKMRHCNKNKIHDFCISCRRVVWGKCTGKAEYRYKEFTKEVRLPLRIIVIPCPWYVLEDLLCLDTLFKRECKYCVIWS